MPPSLCSILLAVGVEVVWGIAGVWNGPAMKTVANIVGVCLGVGAGESSLSARVEEREKRITMRSLYD